MDLRQLFEYNSMVRRSFLDALSKLPWDEVIKNREPSFYSMRNIFLHTLDVEERLIHYLIRGKIASWVKREFDEFNSVETIRARMLLTDEETAKTVQSLTQENLAEIVEFPRRDLPSVRMTVEDALVQNLTEQIHHRGELIALLWQMNIQPPSMQWHWYVDEANHGLAQQRTPLGG
jgi:uncharacterized damage-inducible protein DinB